jgi:hypothetical protein
VVQRRRILAKLTGAFDGEPERSLPPPGFYDDVLARGEESVAADRVCSKHAASRLCAVLAGV